MKAYISFVLVVITAVLAVLAACSPSPGSRTSILDFQITDPRREILDLSLYKGKVVMIVNTATACGLTPQFTALEKLYREYSDRGFVIIGFPSNSFNQEPLEGERLIAYCDDHFLVTFPLTRRIDVDGPYQSEIYTFLTSPQTNPSFPGAIRWNFEKFIIGRDEKVIARFAPDVEPYDQSVISVIEEALKENSFRSFLMKGRG